MVNEYPSNSQQRRPAPAPDKPKTVEKIVTGNVTMRKPTLGKKARELFLSGSAQSVWGYVAYDILLPALKDTLADVVIGGVERSLFGDSRGPRSRSMGSGPSFGQTNYGNFSKSPSGRYAKDDRQVSRRARSTHSFGEIVLDTRAEADQVLMLMTELVDTYGQATVNDLYSALGVTGEFTDVTYGWTDLMDARVIRRNYGYILDLPPTEVLEK